MTGVLAEAHLLRMMGWSWQDYIDAPNEVVEALFILLASEAEVSKSQS